MEKRLLIAFVLSMAVLFAYGLLFPQPKPVVTKQAGIPPKEEKSAAGAVDKGDTKPQGMPAPQSEGQTAQLSVPERDVVVDTELYRAVISSRGGVIKSWKLKKYTDTEGKPVEMEHFGQGVMPLLVVPDGVTPDDAARMDYSIEGGDIELSGEGEAGLTLTSVSADGRTIVKKLVFRSGTYAFGVEVDAAGYAGYELMMGESFGSMIAAKDKGYGHVGFVTMVDGSIEKDEPEDLDAPMSYSGAAGWAAVTDKYFIGAVVPEGKLDAALRKGVSDLGYVGVKSKGAAKFLVYAGPKEYDILKSAGHELQQAVDFGWFTFIAKPLFVALKFFHGMVGNYGWAIVIITIIVKLIFAPLTHKQQKSMKRMQKLQPMINELKEKYKGDAQKMNMEMMELYKREKVNPLGGCLPMVIQIPVFVALYNVLNNAIELRHAPFALWIHDLSAKDPYYILPLAMGASMFVMQKMTPTSMDPTQNKIMMFLPVIFTFMFISLPSGLVLYFTLSNLLSMAQQLYINKTAEA